MKRTECQSILCFWCSDIEESCSSGRVVIAKASQRRRFVNVNPLFPDFKVLRPPIDDNGLRGDALARRETFYLLGDQLSAPNGKLSKNKCQLESCIKRRSQNVESRNLALNSRFDNLHQFQSLQRQLSFGIFSPATFGRRKTS